MVLGFSITSLAIVTIFYIAYFSSILGMQSEAASYVLSFGTRVIVFSGFFSLSALVVYVYKVKRKYYKSKVEFLAILPSVPGLVLLVLMVSSLA